MKKILVISSGSFSGCTNSLINALKAKGYMVAEEKNTLRHLRFRLFYVVLIYLDAVLKYGIKFNDYKHMTLASALARGKVSNIIIRRYNDIGTVIHIEAKALITKKVRGITYALFDDHTNIISKKIAGFDASEKKVHPSWNVIEKKIFHQQDKIFVMGSHVKQSMVEDYGVNNLKITVVGGGPNVDLDIERDRHTKDYTLKNIIFVGIDTNRKGLPVLLKAFNRVIDHHPDAMLHIAGVNGESSKNIIYYGRLKGDSLKKLFYTCQIFALPTYREPFGIVFIEAMYAKNVCIGTNIEAIPEIIGDDGILVEPGDHVALAKNITELLSNPEKLKSMAEASYSMAKAKWSWGNVVERMGLSSERG